MNHKKIFFMAALTLLALSLHGCALGQPNTSQDVSDGDIPAPNSSAVDVPDKDNSDEDDSDENDFDEDDSDNVTSGKDAPEETNIPQKDTEQPKLPETQETENAEPYSMEQKYEKLAADNREEIEEACAQYLYHDWLTASNETFSVDEYEIDGRGYGILEPGPEMFGCINTLADFTFYYLDAPEETHSLYIRYVREIGVSYLSIDGGEEYADTDWETIAQLEQEFEDAHNANMANAQPYAPPVQVCSQDAVYQQAIQDAVQKLKNDYSVATGAIGVPDALQVGPGYRYNANNLTYYYDANSSCHILTFCLNEITVSDLLNASYTVNAQYQDYGNGTISNISMSIQ